MKRLLRYLKVITNFKGDLKLNPSSHSSCWPWKPRFTDSGREFNRVRGTKGVVVRVYIVRHGETQANRDGIIQGQRDTALNAAGLEQARMVGEALKDAKLGIAFSSDLSRAVKVREHQTRNINHICSFGMICFATHWSTGS